VLRRRICGRIGVRPLVAHRQDAVWVHLLRQLADRVDALVCVPAFPQNGHGSTSLVLVIVVTPLVAQAVALFRAVAHIAGHDAVAHTVSFALGPNSMQPLNVANAPLEGIHLLA
jgi:hypothetical protein